MSAPVDIHGILERAGADADAPEGSQAWALAQADRVVAELVEAGNAWCDLMPGLAGGPEFDRLTAALAAIRSAS